jgi:hypothetical protein
MRTTDPSSRVVAALEVAWAAIQARHPDVPHVILTLGAGSLGEPRGSLKLGHFAADRWSTSNGRTAELFVGGEGLGRGANGVLETLLHEAAHGVAATRSIKDTSRQGRYHNRKFRGLGEELGLTIAEVDGIGWSGTMLAPGSEQEYAAELEVLGTALTIFRYSESEARDAAVEPGPDAGADDQDDEQEPAAPARPKNGLSVVCGCGRRVRVAQSVLELGPIICGVCNQPFEAA